eukprot:scaffold330_cov179-Chaetoceros_neogracile.AAC.5
MQACVIHRGAQGGILCHNGARLSLHQIHCCNNAASGLELRSGGRANLEGCHFYNNGRQGVMAWQGAGVLKATNCEIHSHQMESGVLVSEAKAILHLCKIYGNYGAGLSHNKKEIYSSLNTRCIIILREFLFRIQDLAELNDAIFTQTIQMGSS